MKALVSILLAYGVAVPLQAQGPTRPTGTLPANSLQATSFIGALIKIATRFELPLAVEWLQSADTLRPVQLDQRDSASAMLDAMISSHSGYSWQLENGVLHVFERSLVSDPRNPLNIIVDKFPEDAVTVPYADSYLFETVREVVRPTGLPGIAGNLSAYSGELKFQIQTHNDSVREVLEQDHHGKQDEDMDRNVPGKAAP